MSSISRDPDEVPDVPDELVEQAFSLGFHIISVICENEADESDAVQFVAMTPFLPRAGDELLLEDGHRCRVIRSLYRVTRNGACLSLIPNVTAALIVK